MRKRDLELDPEAAPRFLNLPWTLRWRILEALDRLAMDPYLLDLREEDDEAFIIVEGFAVFVEVDDSMVSVLKIRRYVTN